MDQKFFKGRTGCAKVSVLLMVNNSVVGACFFNNMPNGIVNLRQTWLYPLYGQKSHVVYVI